MSGEGAFLTNKYCSVWRVAYLRQLDQFGQLFVEAVHGTFVGAHLLVASLQVSLQPANTRPLNHITHALKVSTINFLPQDLTAETRLTSLTDIRMDFFDAT